MTLRILAFSESGAREQAAPESPPPLIELGHDAGFLWLSLSREDLRNALPQLQATLLRLTGTQLVDLHVSDLLNEQLPSHYDYTSLYDLLVFRRLAGAPVAAPVPARAGLPALRSIDTRPVGFVVFERVLLSVHPEDMGPRDALAERLLAGTSTAAAGSAAAAVADARTRLPASTADLMLRLVNQSVDGYLALRRDLTAQLDAWQAQLIDPKSHFSDWGALLSGRQSLRQLDEVTEDQRAAIQDWIDALETLPKPAGPAAARERDLLLVRGRDVLEHIERVVHYVRRLESNAETAVQMHFNVQSNRTNDIMRVLTVLTAVFLPLNLIAGIFGMNFDSIPLLHKADGFWIAMGAMLFITVLLVAIFRRKRYLERSGR